MMNCTNDDFSNRSRTVLWPIISNAHQFVCSRQCKERKTNSPKKRNNLIGLAIRPALPLCTNQINKRFGWCYAMQYIGRTLRVHMRQSVIVHIVNVAWVRYLSIYILYILAFYNLCTQAYTHILWINMWSFSCFHTYRSSQRTTKYDAI